MGSITLSMTYGIDVHPYNDPNMKTLDEATEISARLFIAGAFLVDIIPILKYVPEWFPGARFQRKAAIMRKHAAKIRNLLFATTEKLMVCDPLFFSFLRITRFVLRPVVTMIPRSSQRDSKRSNLLTPSTKIRNC